MRNNTNTTIGQLLLALTIGTSTVASLDYEEESIMPSKTALLVFQADITDWSKNIPNEVPYYIKTSEGYKTDILIGFAEKLLKESIDIDPEFANVINDYYWDLI